MSNDSASPPKGATGGAHEQIESFLQTVLRGQMGSQEESRAEQAGKVGHPVNLPSVSLWLAVLVAVLRGFKSQRAIWRLLAAGGWWSQPSYEIGDQAVYKRLEEEGWQPLAKVFERGSHLLAEWLQPALQASHRRHATLAPFATEVVALDEMHLDQVKRRLPILRHFKKGDLELLPGKLVALFDVRLQQWRAIDYIEQASGNGVEQAKALLSSLKLGALLLADLGYFGFEWFDQLTELGYSWVSRVKDRTSVVVLHTYYEAGETFDRLVWLGAWNTHGKHVVRQVQFRQGGQLRQYFTNVCDPRVLPLAEIARLYARRWDIELAFLTLKRDLGLHLIWSSKSGVILAQVWACLIIAQVLQAIRMEVALRANVDVFEVSLPLLIEALPQFGLQGRDSIAECVRQGQRLGILRPSTRLRIKAPEIPPEKLIPLPKDAVLCRQPRYSSQRGADKAIKPDQQVPPQERLFPEAAESDIGDTQKAVRHQASSQANSAFQETKKPRSQNLDLPVHPQRDQLVAILLRREAEIKAAARQARAKAQMTEPKTEPVQPKAEAVQASKAKGRTRPVLAVQPDPTLRRPTWAFLQPLRAEV